MKGTGCKNESCCGDFSLDLRDWHVNRDSEIDIIFANLLKRTDARTRAAAMILFPIFPIFNVKETMPIFEWNRLKSKSCSDLILALRDWQCQGDDVNVLKGTASRIRADS